MVKTEVSVTKAMLFFCVHACRLPPGGAFVLSR